MKSIELEVRCAILEKAISGLQQRLSDVLDVWGLVYSLGVADGRGLEKDRAALLKLTTPSLTLIQGGRKDRDCRDATEVTECSHLRLVSGDES